ncbi:MAG: glycoside hydrolase [Clostridia bacterium]|nr:MAG: glycoside hydrolase [Clostridia bacterium]
MENDWYYVSDPTALTDLRQRGEEIDFLLPFWFGVTAAGGLAEQVEEAALALIRRLNLPVLAIVHNYSSPDYGPLLHRLLTTPELRRSLVASILNMLQRWGFAGVNIDFEFVPPADRPFLTQFMTELYTALHPAGFLVTISVPAEVRDNPQHPFSGAFNYPALAAVSDRVYVLAYDEHYTLPGPIASLGFVRSVLAYAVSVIPREKNWLGVPVYGYDWAEGARAPETLSYEQAVSRARQVGAAIFYDAMVQELTYSYQADGVAHTVWFEDVNTVAVKLDLARQYGVPGVAFWRLGLEDRRVWGLVG